MDDSLCRQFIFDEEGGVFQPRPSLEYHDHCVLCVKCYTLSHPHTPTPLPPPHNLTPQPSPHNPTPLPRPHTSSPLPRPHTPTPLSLLFSAATDGCVAVWSLTTQLEQWGVVVGGGQRSDPLTQQPVLVFKAHQSGVNDIAVSYQGEHQSNLHWPLQWSYSEQRTFWGQELCPL